MSAAEKETSQSFEILKEFGERYRADADVRARIARGDTSDLGLNIPAGMEVRVVEQAADTLYFQMPPKPAGALSDEALTAVAGGVFTAAGGHVPGSMTWGITCAGPGRG